MINTILAQYEQEAYTAYENVTGTIIREPNGSLKEEFGRNDAVDAYRHAYTGNRQLQFKCNQSHELSESLEFLKGRHIHVWLMAFRCTFYCNHSHLVHK